MRLDKKILRSERLRRWACWLAAQYIRLVYHTGRWTIEGDETPRALVAQNKPFIVAFWHARLLMMSYAWTYGRPFHMLISQHRDGMLIAGTVGHHGISTIAGSSSRGGTAALRTIVKTLKSGEVVGITPDGPRGPRMRASDGAVSIARLANVPILPLTYGSAARKVFGSWDRFLLPLPFSRGVFIWGEPVFVAKDADAQTLETARQRVEDELNAITARADGRFGQTPIEPAPAPQAPPPQAPPPQASP